VSREKQAAQVSLVLQATLESLAYPVSPGRLDPRAVQAIQGRGETEARQELQVGDAILIC